MSASLHIDPTDGPHAAAALTDDQLEYLSKLMLWELSVRTSKDGFMDYLELFKTLREGNDELIDEVQYERDLMHFEEEVLADLDALPTMTQPSLLRARFT